MKILTDAEPPLQQRGGLIIPLFKVPPEGQAEEPWNPQSALEI